MLLLSVLLLLPAMPTTGAGQTLGERREQREALRRPKLAPDLEETLRQSEKKRPEPQTVSKTLAQLREEKLNRQSAPAASAERQRIIIQPDDLTTVTALRIKVARLDGRVISAHDQTGLMSVELPLERVRELAAESDIAYLSPDRPVTAFASHIEVTTAAEQARKLVSGTTLDGRGVGLAILDSGMDSNHKLIRASSGHPGIVGEVDFIGGSAIIDEFGHGTHIGSIAAGSKDLRKGAYLGIAPGVSLLSLKVLDHEGAGVISSVIAALDWCIANRSRYNIRVINLSLGAVAKDSYQNDPLCHAARRAHAAGILVVAAAGNDGKDEQGNKLYGGIHSPGIDPSVITVGAVNTFGTDRRSDDLVASYSSRGPTRGYVRDWNGVKHYDNLIKPDLVAPGNKIIGACSSNPNEEERELNNLALENPTLLTGSTSKVDERVMYLSGTSVSAPLVAGAAALLLQANPGLTPNLVKAILMYTAQPIQGFNTLEQGAGLLNIDGAVRLARIIRADAAMLSSGASMLSGSWPSAQCSTIEKETCWWGQSVITNYCFLYGSNLMTRWQRMYSRHVVLADSTRAVNDAIRQVPGFTSAGVLNSSGIVFADGRVMADGTLIASGIVFADGVTYSSGIVFADGRMIADTSPTSARPIKCKIVFPGD
jgi:subtilisin family serine protease